MVGKTFPHYAVLEKAGAGGMGVVFRARDETLHRDVALKLPSTNNLTDAESRERVVRDARTASTLNHPHICTVYEVGEVDGKPYIAMEYLAGETLSRRIPPNGLPTELVLDLGAQIADAMDHAHTQGILHRDLKSANVRMTSLGRSPAPSVGPTKSCERLPILNHDGEFPAYGRDPWRRQSAHKDQGPIPWAVHWAECAGSAFRRRGTPCRCMAARPLPHLPTRCLSPHDSSPSRHAPLAGRARGTPRR